MPGFQVKHEESEKQEPKSPESHQNGSTFTLDMTSKDTLVNKDVEAAEEDPWTVSDLNVKSVPWSELSCKGKMKRVLWNYIFRQILLIGLLYMFICSLDFLSSAFRLLGGRAAGEVFQDSKVLSNPVAGLMIGVLATVILQSSSTTTSIVVSMVGSELLTVEVAIPIIMGSNIGTSITNTLVSLSQSGDRNQFRRAFGGSVIHDMFNMLTVIVLLPVEVATGYLAILSLKIVDSMPLVQNKNGDIEIIKAITEPFTNYIIKVNTKGITDIALNKTTGTSLIKTSCGTIPGTNGTNSTESIPCQFMFMNVAGVWEDWVIGLILLFMALLVLCTCLILVVKVLNSIFQGPIAVLLQKFVNSNVPKVPESCGRELAGYIAIVIGTVLTILVQSSSVFTSTLTPLVGLGVISLERVFPLTLGSNIGTTFTAILSSLAQDSKTIKRSIQISMCHLFFNISGILIWYPVPFMRRAPLYLAKRMGNITAKYRWFAIVYILSMFFLFPAAIFGLSAAGWQVAVGVLAPLAFIIIVAVIINVIQSKKPSVLPTKLRTWDFLPAPLHSFKPYDKIFIYLGRVCQRRKTVDDEEEEHRNRTSKL